MEEFLNTLNIEQLGALKDILENDIDGDIDFLIYTINYIINYKQGKIKYVSL